MGWNGGPCGVSILLVATAVCGSACASEPRATGLLADDAGWLAAQPKASLKRSLYLPPQVDLSSRMPGPADQGKVGACMSYTLGYATLGYYLSQQAGAEPGDPATTPSAAFLHDHIHGPGKCLSTGALFKPALAFLMKSDLAAENEVPGSAICTASARGPVRRPLDDGVVGYEFILTESVKPDSAAAHKAIAITKQKLAEGNPVPIGVQLYCDDIGPDGSCVSNLQSFLEESGDEVYMGSRALSSGWQRAGGHAMTLVGYDDTRRAFRVQNSWGADLGDGGRFWMAYDALVADALGVVALKMRTPPKPATRSDPFVPEGVSIGSCSLLVRSAEGIEGFVENAADRESLVRAIGRERVAGVTIRPWPVCAALRTLDGPLHGGRLPTVRKLDGRTDLRIGDSLGFEVTTPDFPSFLYVYYFQADGTVVNLVPRGGPVRTQRPPGTRLVFGDGAEGRQTFKAAAPPGAEMVVALAARAPIFELEDLEVADARQYRLAAADRDVDVADGAQDQLFLSILSEALAGGADGKAAGRQVAAGVLHLNIRE